MTEIYISGNLPVLALRGIAVFPEQTVHFDVGRIKSAMALEEAMKKDQTLFLVPQKDIVDDDPDLGGLFPIGTVVKVKQILKSQNDNIRVLVTGLYRARITELTQTEPFLAGVVETVSEVSVTDNLRARALRREATFSPLISDAAATTSPSCAAAIRALSASISRCAAFRSAASPCALVFTSATELLSVSATSRKAPSRSSKRCKIWKLRISPH